MAVAQGVNKQLAYKKQAGLGTVASGSGGQSLRRVTANFNVAKDTYSSDEIVSHQMKTDDQYGIAKSSATLNGLVSGKTWQDFFDSLLRQNRASFTSITALTLTIAASGSNYTITRSAGDFLSGGVKIGMIITLAGGSLNTNNTADNLVVLGVTATVLTVAVLKVGGTLTAEGPIASCTVAAAGKSTFTPTSGHTNDYYTFEEWFSDLTRSHVYPDCQIGKVDISLPSTGNATANFEVVGLGVVTRSGAQSLTTPTAATSTSVMSAVAGAIFIGTTRYATITSFQMTVDGSVTQGEAVIGSNSIPDTQRGRIMVSGSFSALLDGDALTTATFDAETATNMVVVLADSRSDTAACLSFSMPNVKIMSAELDDGEKQLIRSHNFSAAYYGSGGAALAHNATILQVHDTSAT